jgi:hypothetical protein
MAKANGKHQAIADFADLFVRNVSSLAMFEFLPRYRYMWTADVVNDAQVKCNKKFAQRSS